MSVQWIPVEAEVPDSDVTVLIACSDGNEPVWVGYLDSESPNETQWRTCEGSFVTVTHWADLPDLPTSGKPAPAKAD